MNETINLFFEKLKNNENVLGILLFGSWARGNNRPDSDVDLIVILREGFRRTVEFENNIAFEITYTTEQGAADFWRDNPDDCVDLWKSAKIIFDRDGTMQRLKQVGIEIENKGKHVMDENKIEHLAFDAKDQLKAIKNLIESDLPTANLILTNKIFSLVGLYFDIRQQWKPAPKQFLKVIEEKNPLFANLLKAFYSETDINRRLEIAEKIVTTVFTI